MALKLIILGMASALLALPASGHEFWIDPHDYQLEDDQPIVADIRVGQYFKGNAYSYVPNNFARFELLSGGQTSTVEGILGDRPALTAQAVAENELTIIVHETTDSRLTYTEWEKFVAFVEHKDFGGVLAAHEARGLPQTRFVETYRRYAKSLVAVGRGTGQDRVVGLETEIIALANPYTDTLREGIPVQVLYLGAPRVDAQLEIFDKAPDGQVTVSTMRSDERGRARVPVAPGHSYLLDAVVLRSTGNDDPAAGPVWHSLWASLTFGVPAR